MIILVCGFIGVGKTTASKMIADKIGGNILRTDIIRNKIYPNPTHSKEEIQHVYEIFFKELIKLLRENKHVILDGTFHIRRNREKIIDIAKKYNVDFKIVEVICNSDEEVKRRIESRNDGVTKTDFHQYLKHKSEFEKVDDVKIVINNSSNLIKLKKQIDNIFSDII